jgi:hypothetical protein
MTSWKLTNWLLGAAFAAVIMWSFLVNRSLDRNMDELEKTRTEVSRLLKERTAQVQAELKPEPAKVNSVQFQLAAKCEGLGGVPVGGVHESVVCVRTGSIIELGNPTEFYQKNPTAP